MTATVAAALRDASARLQGVADNPRREARLLLAHALGVTQNDLIRTPDQPVETAGFEALVARRTAHEPLARIIGHREFWSMEFEVSPATLIPRADSETVIEAALAAFAGRPPPNRILDLGTGTGCLLVALLKEYPDAFGVGVDRAPSAAVLAAHNARRLGFPRRSAFFCGDWFQAVDARFDLIVSNPPYVAEPDLPGLMPEVANYEPHLALAAGSDGCDAYRALVPELPRFLEPDGVAVLELGAGQSDVVDALASDHGFVASLRLDLAGIPRAMILFCPAAAKNCLAARQ